MAAAGGMTRAHALHILSWSISAVLICILSLKAFVLLHLSDTLSSCALTEDSTLTQLRDMTIPVSSF